MLQINTPKRELIINKLIINFEIVLWDIFVKPDAYLNDLVMLYKVIHANKIC